MNCIDREEANSRCHVCAMGLSWIENYLYGNRCVMCAEEKKTIKGVTLIILVFLDWLIYKKILDMSKLPDVKVMVTGALGEEGFFDPNNARTIGDKIKVLFSLGRCSKRYMVDK